MKCQRCNSQMVGNSFKRDRYSYFDYSQELINRQNKAIDLSKAEEDGDE